jgi:Uncharacterized conserved protein
MTYLDRINQDLTTAMKAREELKLSTLRMIKATLKNREIEKMAPLEDGESIKALQSMVKQRRDSAQQYRDAGRNELAEKEEGEISIIESYLPAALDDAAIDRIVTEALTQAGATGPKDMGKAMKAVMSALSGQTVDGAVINKIVRAKLGV